MPHSRKSENITCTDWLPKEGAGDAYAFKNTPVRDIWRQRVSGTTLYGERDLIWDFGSVSSTLTFRRKTAAARPDLSKSWIWQKDLVTQITLEPLLRKRGAKLLLLLYLYFVFFVFSRNELSPAEGGLRLGLSLGLSLSPSLSLVVLTSRGSNINKCFRKICLNLQFQNQPLVISTATLSPEKEVNNQSTHSNIPHHLRLSKKVLFGA